MEKKKDELPSITIWVHGTLFIFRHLIPKFLHIEQGLTPIANAYQMHYYRTVAQKLNQTDPQRFSFEHFYLFGWSGKLGFEERLRAAHQLKKELLDAIAIYQKKYGARPPITLITHSHGGNVALNLGKIATKQELIIDNLVLLACPVQKETESLTQRDCFKSIASLYSTRDIIQVIDPQGIYEQNLQTLLTKNIHNKPLFSQRLFEPQEKILQASIELQNRKPFHADFMLQHFLQHIPKILDTLETHKKENPAHCFEKPITIRLN